jgi:eukaryotic-like serine/threonine-protein kinase
MTSRYQILEKLGEGGSGAVYKAYDKTLNRQVAIKRLSSMKDAVRTADIKTALCTEASLMARARHPGIITTYDLAEDQEGMFIVMELLSGQELTKWIRSKPMDWPDFVQTVLQTLSAIIAMHQKGILHLDLTPDNIRMQRQNDGCVQAVIIDFGLAQHAPKPVRQRLGTDGRLFGSVRYMAPEQFHLREVDARTDLYALGCVYYQCLTAKAPFRGATSEAIRDAHLNHQLNPLHQMRPDLPQSICDWIDWMIKPQIHQRPSTTPRVINNETAEYAPAEGTAKGVPRKRTWYHRLGFSFAG